jgi:hypothetical protein
MTEIRAEAGCYLPVMSHCICCRADAVGLLGESVPPQSDLRLLIVHYPSPNPSKKRAYVAGASREGTLYPALSALASLLGRTLSWRDSTRGTLLSSAVTASVGARVS